MIMPSLSRQDSMCDQLFEEVRQLENICEEHVPLPTVLQTLILEYLHFDTFCWDNKMKGSFIKLSKASRSAKCTSSSGTSWQTVAGSRVWDMGRHYFEISVDALPENKTYPAQIALGFVPDGKTDWVTNGYAVPGFSVPGWVLNLESGQVSWYPDSSSGPSQTTVFYKDTNKTSLVAVGTRIGLCIDLDQGCIEYTINGRALGRAFHDAKGHLRAVASMTRDGTQISLHFPRT